MATRSGKIDFVVGDETFQTFYYLFGDLNSPNCPVVACTGGPGFGCDYMFANADLWERHQIPVIVYDQVGIARSTILNDKPDDFWTIELFMDELENLVHKLGISDNFHLLGHSWGGILSSSFAYSRQPKGLKRIVLASSPASMPLWEKGARERLDELPKEVRDKLVKHEEAGTTDDPEYEELMGAFIERFVCRVVPMPETLAASFAAMAENPRIYNIMQGPSEFTITGTLKTWSSIDQLHKIQQEVLLINGFYDEGRDLCMQPFFDKIKKVKWVKFMESSHLACLEEHDRYIEVVASFLKGPL